MKKNGFTLVELLAVITLISVISLIAMPAVQESIYTSKQKAYDTQISNIVKAAKDWSSENLSYLPEEDGESITITLYSLMSLGYIEDNLINPKTDKYFDPNTVITITRKNKDYKYDVEVIFSNEKVEVDHDAPILFLNGDYITYVEINDSEGYKDLGVTSDISNLSYTTNYYKVTNNSESSVTSISIDSLSKYRVEYCASNDGKESCISRYVVIRDTIAPVITVPITETISASQVASYNLKSGVSVTDNSGKSITPTVSGKLSTTPGKYVITYTATDASGNKKTKKRTIIVGCTCSESNTCTVYNDGQPVYFNVTTGKKCSESEAISVGGTKSGCMKFYAFNDNNSSCYVNLLLGHNSTPKVAWASSGTTMKEVITALNNDTSSWVNTEYINETIDGFDYSGYKARLLSYDEAMKANFNCSNNYSRKCYSWVWTNLDSSNSATSPHGYWLSKIHTDGSQAWLINYTGHGQVWYANQGGSVGLRPVININKSLLK